MGRPCSVSPLKIARVASGLRQGEVAELLGYSATRYGHRENGRTRVSVDDAIRLSKILKTPVEKLFPRNGK